MSLIWLSKYDRAPNDLNELSSVQADGVLYLAEDLIQLFEQTFFDDFNTRLVRGDDEPVYLPADHQCPFNRIVFAHGFFSSALHEIAHWCLAGEARRELEDYGYWYSPDGRNAEQQAAFEDVEVKPQAIEAAFCAAAGAPFQVSTDNLNGVTPDRHAFQQRVESQLQAYRDKGFPVRAKKFISALNLFYRASTDVSSTAAPLLQREESERV